MLGNHSFAFQLRKLFHHQIKIKCGRSKGATFQIVVFFGHIHSTAPFNGLSFVLGLCYPLRIAIFHMSVFHCIPLSFAFFHFISLFLSFFVHTQSGNSYTYHTVLYSSYIHSKPFSCKILQQRFCVAVESSALISVERSAHKTLVMILDAQPSCRCVNKVYMT